MELSRAGGELTPPTHENITSELLVLAGTIAGLSEGRIRVAVNEEDETTAPQPEAAHFIKVDERRLGRDLELYGFMAKLSSDAHALSDFVGEVMVPLWADAPEVHEATAPLVEQLGYRFIDEERHAAWAAIFEVPSSN